MTAADEIRAELAHATDLTAGDLRAFLAEDIPPSALSWTPCGRPSMIKRDRVMLHAGRFEFGRYSPAAPAVGAFVMPLLDEAGDPVDILAADPAGPVALWEGRVAMAGQEQVLAPRPDLGDALDVHETFLGWLRAGRAGILILNPSRAAGLLEGTTLRARTTNHARWLRAALARPAPRIVTAGAEEPMARAQERAA